MLLVGTCAFGATLAHAGTGLRYSRRSLNFGEILFRGLDSSPTSAPHTVRISNSGPAITGLNIQVTGNDAGDFQAVKLRGIGVQLHQLITPPTVDFGKVQVLLTRRLSPPSPAPSQGLLLPTASRWIPAGKSMWRTAGVGLPASVASPSTRRWEAAAGLLTRHRPPPLKATTPSSSEQQVLRWIPAGTSMWVTILTPAPSQYIRRLGIARDR